MLTKHGRRKSGQDTLYQLLVLNVLCSFNGVRVVSVLLNVRHKLDQPCADLFALSEVSFPVVLDFYRAFIKSEIHFHDAFLLH